MASGWIGVRFVDRRAILLVMRDTPQFHCEAPDCYRANRRDNMIALQRRQRHYYHATRNNLAAAVIA